MLFIGYFLDFEIEERLFHVFDSLLESLPVFNILQRLIFCQVFVAVVVPPTFCILCDIDGFRIHHPGIVYDVSKIVNNSFQLGYIQNVRCVQLYE